MNLPCDCAEKFSKTLYSALWFGDPSPPTQGSIAIFTVTQLLAAHVKVRNLHESCSFWCNDQIHFNPTWVHLVYLDLCNRIYNPSHVFWFFSVWRGGQRRSIPVQMRRLRFCKCLSLAMKSGFSLLLLKGGISIQIRCNWHFFCCHVVVVTNAPVFHFSWSYSEIVWTCPTRLISQDWITLQWPLSELLGVCNIPQGIQQGMQAIGCKQSGHGGLDLDI